MQHIDGCHRVVALCCRCRCRCRAHRKLEAENGIHAITVRKAFSAAAMRKHAQLFSASASASRKPQALTRINANAVRKAFSAAVMRKHAHLFSVSVLASASASASRKPQAQSRSRKRCNSCPECLLGSGDAKACAVVVGVGIAQAATSKLKPESMQSLLSGRPSRQR